MFTGLGGGTGGNPLLGPLPFNPMQAFNKARAKGRPAPAAAGVLGRTAQPVLGPAPNPLAELLQQVLQRGQQSIQPGGLMQGVGGPQVDPGFNLGPQGPAANQLPSPMPTIKNQMQQMRQHMIAARIAQLQKSFNKHRSNPHIGIRDPQNPIV